MKANRYQKDLIREITGCSERFVPKVFEFISQNFRFDCATQAQAYKEISEAHQAAVWAEENPEEWAKMTNPK